MAPDVRRLAADLEAEQQALDAVVSALTEDQWQLPTPSPGWTVADQIGHLTYFDGTAAQAIADPAAFVEARRALVRSAAAGGAATDDLTLAATRAMTAAELHDAWREGRQRLAAAAATLSDATRVEWYGPSMGARSFLTARLMEAWAHGQDVVDAARAAGVAVERPPTSRLRHIAQLGVITRGWSYANRGLTVPPGDVRVELDGPDGDAWTWGPAGAPDVVRGPAEDLCLVVTQRRHHLDTDLHVEGDAALDWLVNAQAFAGAATDGPAPTRP